jgi:hypothetical protein
LRSHKSTGRLDRVLRGYLDPFLSPGASATDGEASE